MSRYNVFAMALGAALLISGTTCAQTACPEGMSWSQSFRYDYHRNNQWPKPFRAMDTGGVLNYFEVQRNNGWKMHNTLGNAMFDPTTNSLTDSGRNHMRWIITQAPQDRRVVFVLVGNDQQETALRVESTQLAISEMVPVGPLPTIYLTDRDAPGSSGVYQTAINRAMTSSVPAPRLPVAANNP